MRLAVVAVSRAVIAGIAEHGLCVEAPAGDFTTAVRATTVVTLHNRWGDADRLARSINPEQRRLLAPTVVAAPRRCGGGRRERRRAAVDPGHPRPVRR